MNNCSKAGAVVYFSTATTEYATCNTLVAYWVSWKDGALAAWLGATVGANMIIFWQDPSPSFQVNSVSVSSPMNVTWVIPNRYYITGK